MYDYFRNQYGDESTLAFQQVGSFKSFILHLFIPKIPKFFYTEDSINNSLILDWQSA